jgi:glycosyltransferase involved in cell wall biosynthesis
LRILCVIDSLNCGGAQRQICELAKGFKERGNDISFLVYHNIPFFNTYLDKAGILITQIPEGRYLNRIIRMRRFIRKGNYDAVLSFLEAPNFICEVSGLPFRRWKLVVGERNSDPGISKSLKLRLYRCFHIFADYVVANSYSNIQKVRKVNPFLRLSKCKVIYNIVDFDRWKPPVNFECHKDSKLKLIIPARHTAQKNLNGLLEALVLLNSEEQDKIKIEWYGDRINEPFIDSSFPEGKLKTTRSGLTDIISYYPATADITALIQDADAVGLFSFYEGFPNALCEAMACGKTIICSEVSDLPAFLSHDINLLCNPSQIQTIKSSLSYLINLSPTRLKQIGMENERIAKEKFHREAIISDYLELLSK